MRGISYTLLQLVVVAILFFCKTSGKVLTVNPDRVAPDTLAFSSLSEALVFAHPGDTILIGPGCYDPTVEQFPIVIDKPLKIRSLKGPEVTVFRGLEREVVFIIMSPGVEIMGITIQHIGTGITVMADNVRIIGNRIELLPHSHMVFTCGIWLVGACCACILKNAFVNCGLAIAGPRPRESDIEKPSLTGIFLVGEDKRWFTTHIIEDNLVNGAPLFYLVGRTGTCVPKEVGQVIIANCSDVTISGLNIAHASIGIQIVHSHNVQVTDCKLSENSVFGLYIAYSEDCRVNRLQVIGNNHGIDIRASAGIVVSNCTVVENEQGVFFSYTESNLISNCIVSANGIGIYSGSSHGNLISHNTITKNRYGVVAQNDNSLQTIGNRIKENELSGIRLSPSCRNIKVMRNDFSNNSTHFLAAGANGVVLLRNKMKEASWTGVYLWDSAEVSVIGNHFSENTVDLEAMGSTYSVVLRFNWFVGNAVSVRNESTAEIDARLNWWGTVNIEKVFSSLEGSVVFMPILPALEFFSSFFAESP